MTFRDLYDSRWAEWKTAARAQGLSQETLNGLEASLDAERDRFFAVLRAGVHCGRPLVVKRDPWGRSLVHVSCALGVEKCPNRFLFALEGAYLEEIQASSVRVSHT